MGPAHDTEAVVTVADQVGVGGPLVLVGGAEEPGTGDGRDVSTLESGLRPVCRVESWSVFVSTTSSRLAGP